MKEIFRNSPQKKSGLYLKVTAIHYDRCTKSEIMLFYPTSFIIPNWYLRLFTSRKGCCFQEEKIILKEKSDHASISEKLGHRSSTPAYPPSWLKEIHVVSQKIHCCFQNK